MVESDFYTGTKYLFAGNVCEKVAECYGHFYISLMASVITPKI